MKCENGTSFLYNHDNTIESQHFYKIPDGGPKLYTNQELEENLNYPTPPNEPLYLIYNLANTIEPEFHNIKWDISGVIKKGTRKKPLSISLTELMRLVVK